MLYISLTGAKFDQFIRKTICSNLGHFPFGAPDDDINLIIERQRTQQFPTGLLGTAVRQLLTAMLDPNPRRRSTTKAILEHNWFLQPRWVHPSMMFRYILMITKLMNECFSATNTGRALLQRRTEAAGTDRNGSRTRMKEAMAPRSLHSPHHSLYYCIVLYIHPPISTLDRISMLLSICFSVCMVYNM